MFAADLREFAGAAWDEPRRRVIGRREVWFRDLLLESAELRDCPVGPAATLLANHIVDDGLVMKKWDDAVEQWIARLACLSEWMPELELPGFGDDDRRAVIEQVCHGQFAYKDVKDRDLWPVLHDWLSAPQRSALDHYAPVRVALPDGRHTKVNYERGREPWLAARVQHLFGMQETPRVAGGKVAVIVHVLAPNQRPWQVTKDLKNFWATGYPQMRKDLARRYPRHDWREI
jgi:ATP-dependent helicase HrpB